MGDNVPLNLGIPFSWASERNERGFMIWYLKNSHWSGKVSLNESQKRHFVKNL